MLDLIVSFTFAVIVLISCLGLWILVKLCGRNFLAQGSLMACGSAISAYLINTYFDKQTWSTIAAFAIASFITACVSALYGLIQNYINIKFEVITSALFSIALIYVLRSMDTLSKNGVVRSPESPKVGSINLYKISVGSHNFSLQVSLLIISLIMLFAVIAYTRNIVKSPLSRAMRVLKNNEQFARTLSISKMRTVVYAYFISGLFAGISGFLFTMHLHKYDLNDSKLLNGQFGLIFSALLLIIVYLTSTKRLLASIMSILSFVFIYSYVSIAYPSDTYIVKHIGTEQLSIIIIALFAILFVLVSSRNSKSKV